MSTKKGRRKRRLEEQRKKKSGSMALWVIGAASVLLVGGWFAMQMTKRSVGTAVTVQAKWHLASRSDPHPPYNSLPPTSGPHMGRRARWGIHKEPIPDELQVHNLEDAGVMVQYNCGDCGILIRRLESIVGRYDEYVVLAPYPRLDRKIALTAWGRIDKFDQFDEKRIVKFIEAYKGIDHH
ncbi:DUF3105 domain-containing protein [Nitrospinae bacterium AH_259_B05_G02_I21]|nr:DUF3105 domain-containing protein [Nitrospinae bacterium AH_259_B05_G02_I21]